VFTVLAAEKHIKFLESDALRLVGIATCLLHLRNKR
jgi:hypothetical protein